MEYTHLYREIGARIRDRRRQLGKTQEELAATVQLSRPSLANIESGRQTILVHQLCLLAKTLELPVHDLLPEFRALPTNDDETPIMPLGLSESQQQQIKALLSPSNSGLVLARNRKG